MKDTVFCPHCYKKTSEFTTNINETSITLDDNVEYRYIEKVAICNECENPCISDEYREHNSKAFNDVVRTAHSCIPQWQIDELFDCYGETLKSISEQLCLEPNLVKLLKNGLCPSREHSIILKQLWLKHALDAGENIPLIAEIRSGGQTGVDRAAFDAAKANEIPICGWCPKGGWAEDMEEYPGLLSLYPELVETPDKTPKQRTQWNVRDADCVIAYYPSLDLLANQDISEGTNLAVTTSHKLNIPALGVYSGTHPRSVLTWIEMNAGKNATVSIGGPQESESPGIYEEAKQYFETLFSLAKENKE